MDHHSPYAAVFHIPVVNWYGGCLGFLYLYIFACCGIEVASPNGAEKIGAGLKAGTQKYPYIVVISRGRGRGFITCPFSCSSRLQHCLLSKKFWPVVPSYGWGGAESATAAVSGLKRSCIVRSSMATTVHLLILAPLDIPSL